ncbi:MAG TPA: hypothetical protein VGX24_02205 [Pyrinomonadaceae bacterium]|jgi:hypothetical protein|nr:hypothetical protein [Pyrinomonadaceae bacterium]
MSLAEGKIEFDETDLADTRAAMQKWEHFPASTISHHGGQCCQIAREWILSTDYSQLNAGNPLTGPRWLRQKYTWGPSTWPIYWCEAVEQKTLDCGALAALTQEVFAARGVKSYHAQFIQQYSEDATRQWAKKWNGEDASVHWIKEDLIYHEGCAVAVRDNEIRLWDPSAGWWVNPRQTGGYGGLLALRVFAPQFNAPTGFLWGTQRISPNQWQKIERVRGDFAVAATN